MPALPLLPLLSLPDLLMHGAERWPDGLAVIDGDRRWSYTELAQQVQRFAQGLLGLGIARGDRVVVQLDKSIEAVVTLMAVPLLGAIVVPVSTLLKRTQLLHVLRDCGACALVTVAQRFEQMGVGPDDACPNLVVRIGVRGTSGPAMPAGVVDWSDVLSEPKGHEWRGTDADPAVIFYTSGSTGHAKGVVVSHRNLVAGAASVASYLGNNPQDCLLAALPLSFDAGFSQLTTAFFAGARVVLLNYLLPQDVLKTMNAHGVTGLTAVPPLFSQLAALSDSAWAHHGEASALRYFACTGGRMPRATLGTLRVRWPRAKPFLMYGLTEAFRASYLDPAQVDRRPDSMGKAIPGVELEVLGPDGLPCAPREHGELVQRGATVALGYWADPERTHERFRPLPPTWPGMPAHTGTAERVVYSGDIVWRDEDGYLYFVGRSDDMIKTSGYRVSPSEVEEAAYETGWIAECAAVGVADEQLGQAIVLIAMLKDPTLATGQFDLKSACRERLPAYMVPARIDWVDEALPRNANGKIDRRALAERLGAVQSPPVLRP